MPPARHLSTCCPLCGNECTQTLFVKIGKILCHPRLPCPEEAQHAPLHCGVKITQHGKGEPFGTYGAYICVLSKLREVCVLLSSKCTEPRQCLSHRRIVVVCECGQQCTAHAVTPRIHRVVCRIMPRRQPPLCSILLNLHPFDRKQRAQVQPVPHTHRRKPRRPSSAQDAQEDGLGEIVRMMCEDNRVTAALRAHTVQEVIAADARRRLDGKPMLARIDRHIPRRAHARNRACSTELLYKVCICNRICPTNPVFVVSADELRSARRPQTFQYVQQRERIRTARTGDDERTRGAEKALRAQNSFHMFLQNLLLIQKKHSAWSALRYPHLDRRTVRPITSTSALPCDQPRRDPRPPRLESVLRRRSVSRSSLSFRKRDNLSSKEGEPICLVAAVRRISRGGRDGRAGAAVGCAGASGLS